jgi:hypothetical protein
MVGRKKCR